MTGTEKKTNQHPKTSIVRISEIETDEKTDKNRNRKGMRNQDRMTKGKINTETEGETESQTDRDRQTEIDGLKEREGEVKT